MKNKNQLADLTITSLSKKGNGLAVFQRPNALPTDVEVPFTIPGDQVRVRLLQKRKGCYNSILEEVLVPSPLRVPSRCIHFGACGGCRIQHFSYENQLQYKEQFVSHCFRDLLSSGVDRQPIIPCSYPWNYRNKMEYSFSSDASGKRYLGLVIEGSRGKVFNLTECHLANPWFVDVLKSVKYWWHESGLDAYHCHKNTGSLRTLTVREGNRTGDRMIMLTVSGNPDYALQKHHLESFVAYVRDAAETLSPTSKLSIFLRIQQIGKGMPTQMYEMLLHGSDHIREILRIQIQPDDPINELQFDISPSAFFQPNTLQAERLYSAALRMADVPKDGIVYDLYCGTGALGICIAHQVKQVIGIEISPEASLDARGNVKRNNCHNVTIFSGAVKDILKQLPEKGIPPPDLVMVDPPRAGLDEESMQHLLTLRPQKILYVSCNPVTQAANIAEMVKKGYRLSAMQAVDQFPQTFHVENIALLIRI